MLNVVIDRQVSSATSTPSFSKKSSTCSNIESKVSKELSTQNLPCQDRVKHFPAVILDDDVKNDVRIRLRNLGIYDIHLGVADKVEVLKEYLHVNNINAENVLYMGDDLPDYWVMQKVGLPTCPQDAAPEIKNLSKYISHVKGGKGAVRDVIEQVMKVQGKWLEHFEAKFD